MPTTFSNTQKNAMVGWMTGATAPAVAAQIHYINPHNGAQPADPSTAAAGSAVYTTTANAPNMSGFMSAAGGGVSQLSTPRGTNAANTVSSLTWARIYNSTSTPIIDATVSLAGGGGGVILNSLSSTAGSPCTVAQFSIKFPKTNGGTLLLSSPLVNRLAENLAGVSATQPGFGINSTGTSVIDIYSGTPPADADAPATGTLLCSFTIGGVQIYTAATGGASALTGPLTSSFAIDTGTATYARWVKTNGSATFTIQGTVGTSSADFIVSTTSVVVGEQIQITDATISF